MHSKTISRTNGNSFTYKRFENQISMSDILPGFFSLPLSFFFCSERKLLGNNKKNIFLMFFFLLRNVIKYSPSQDVKEIRDTD